MTMRQNGGVNDYQWVNRGHPQTLVTATVLLYLEGILSLIGLGGVYGGYLVCVAMVVGGFGIANDKRWGYGLALAASIVSVGLLLWAWGFGALTNFGPLIDLIFGGALLGLLLHPMSRSYQRIWFR
jgi:hypothetical protein